MDTLTQLRDLLGKVAGAELYRNNPFRRLGLPVLASPREIAKRCDQLKLSSELGISETSRAFAPAQSPSVDQVRESAQQLQDPTLRLLFEFFWFWPIHYPESADDPGLLAIEKGDPEEAFASWCKAFAKGEPAALHNMAVYFHLIALDWDLDDPAANQSDDDIWGPALKYWQRVLVSDPIWESLLKRTQGQVDSSMHSSLATDLRSVLPSVLAGINAQSAQLFAEKGLFARASQHSNLVLALHNDPAEGRRMLESCASSSVRRIDARVADCRRVAEATPEACLPAVLTLLADCEPEIRVIQDFCGAGSPRAREFCQGITAGALDALVAYQRKTQDNRGSLPLFLHLLDKPATPELTQRASEAFEVVYANALASERVSESESHGSAACRLLLGSLIPSERLLNSIANARIPYRARLGGLLARLAESTAANPLAPNLGSRALAQASTFLGATPRSLQGASALVFEMKTPACALTIGAEGITLNGHRVALADLVGVRYGFQAQGNPPQLSQPIIAWSSVSEAWEIDFSAMGAPVEDSLPLYTSTIIALDYFVRPALAETLLKWLHGGEDILIGEHRLCRKGLKFATPEGVATIPFAQLMAGQDASALHLSSRGAYSFSSTLDTASTWNAAIIAQVIDTLARDVETSADDRARISSPGSRA